MQVWSCPASAPCPGNEVWVDLATIIDPALFGVTPQTIGFAFAWGAGAVLTLWIIGYATGASTGIIGKV